MIDPLEVARKTIESVREMALSIFMEVGGTAWYEKMLMGAVVLIVGLLIAIAIVTVYLAFRGKA